MPVSTIRTVFRNVRAALLLALVAAAPAQALSIGEAVLHSGLGEPLRATIPLGHLGTLSEHDLIVGRAPDSDYRKLGVTEAMYTAPLRFSLSVDARGSASVELSSEDPVSEPFIDLVMEVRWPTGRAIKEFNLLLDLP